MIKLSRSIGKASIKKTHNIGSSAIFIFNVICKMASLRQIYLQIYYIGVSSIAIISVSSLFIGFVLGLQGYYTLSKFSASSALGPMVGLSILRELGPVMTALLFAGRAGSSLTAEIALMKATEQLSSLRMMGVDPLKYIIAPRFWASLISMPLLNLVFCALAIYGGYLIGVTILDLYSGTFWGNMQNTIMLSKDIMNGIIKSIIFGFAITWVALYQGYSCNPTPSGISDATTKTVVYSSLLILFLDFLLTAIMFQGL